MLHPLKYVFLLLPGSQHKNAKIAGYPSLLSTNTRPNGYGERPWYDFVAHIFKDTTIQLESFDQRYWLEKFLPKLQSLYDNCLLPEIVSSVHSIGLRFACQGSIQNVKHVS